MFLNGPLTFDFQQVTSGIFGQHPRHARCREAAGRRAVQRTQQQQMFDRAGLDRPRHCLLQRHQPVVQHAAIRADQNRDGGEMEQPVLCCRGIHEHTATQRVHPEPVGEPIRQAVEHSLPGMQPNCPLPRLGLSSTRPDESEPALHRLRIGLHRGAKPIQRPSDRGGEVEHPARIVPNYLEAEQWGGTLDKALNVARHEAEIAFPLHVLPHAGKLALNIPIMAVDRLVARLQGLHLLQGQLTTQRVRDVFPFDRALQIGL